MLWLQWSDLSRFVFVFFFLSINPELFFNYVVKTNKLRAVHQTLGESWDSATIQSTVAHTFQVASLLKIEMASFTIFQDVCKHISEGKGEKKTVKLTYLPYFFGLSYLNHNTLFFFFASCIKVNPPFQSILRWPCVVNRTLKSSY